MDSFIGWVGGKKLLREEICARFPEGIEKYAEVFGGADWVLFYKDKHAKTEVYNDINSNLTNLFKCVKYHHNAVIEEMSCLLNSREIFNFFKRQDTEGLTDIQKAARYLYLIRASYGSKVSDFGAKPRKINRSDMFGDISKRLETVIIENKSYDAIIKQYDSEKTLFYCDPPYYGTERYYDTGNFSFDETQHRTLRDLLVKIKGKFILSYNDCEFVKELYSDFHIEAICRKSNLASRYGQDKIYNELIIRNY